MHAQKEINDQIQIYPNPTSSKVTIELNQPHPYTEVELLNLTGQTIFQKSFSNHRKLELDLGKVAVGIYLLKISNEQNVVMGKIVL
jgi:hypothetical protein